MDDPDVKYVPAKFRIELDKIGNSLYLTSEGIGSEFPNCHGTSAQTNPVSWKVIDEYRKKLEEMESK